MGNEIILQFMIKFQRSNWDHDDYESNRHLILSLTNVQHVITNALIAAGAPKSAADVPPVAGTK